MPGHVFVIRGDLTRLACDAVILPCDDAFNISAVWRDFLPENLPPVPHTNWLRLTNDSDDASGVHLPESKGRRVRAVVTTVQRVVGRTEAPADVAERLVGGVRQVAKGLSAQGGRELPLIAVPLAGTGSGGLRHRRAEVIATLLPALNQAANGCDIALVVWHRSDLAAVQSLRDDNNWADLTPSLTEEADRLGTLAGHDRLSIFVGAGVSKPVGLPDWWQLLGKLAVEADLTIDAKETSAIRAATPIVEKLGPKYHDVMSELLGGEEPQHAIGHALLAGLRVRQMVTTNFDCCLERALDFTVRDGGQYRVLTRALADSSSPWLLKLHGDLAQRGSLVLTEGDYTRQRSEHQAVYGVVQSLMLTSHLLFVGFGLTDRNFLALAKSVATVRGNATSEADLGGRKAGTALALTRAGADKHQDLSGDLDMLPMAESGDEAAAARLLEVFLDRVAWRAAREHPLSAEYLMDPNYSSGLNSSDSALATALQSLVDRLPDEARDSAGWPRVAETLQALGYTSVA